MVGGIGRPLSANVGARLEDNQQFGSFATWRAAARGASTMRPGCAWRRDGFKEPTFFEAYSTGFVSGNPNLRPERSFSWEGGIEHTVPGTRLSLAVTYFDQRFRDLVVYDFSRTPNYVNIARRRHRERRSRWTGPRAAASRCRSPTRTSTRGFSTGRRPHVRDR